MIFQMGETSQVVFEDYCYFEDVSERSTVNVPAMKMIGIPFLTGHRRYHLSFQLFMVGFLILSTSLLAVLPGGAKGPSSTIGNRRAAALMFKRYPVMSQPARATPHVTLTRYGFPPAPSGGAMLELWNETVDHALTVTSLDPKASGASSEPPVLDGPSTATQRYLENWSGHVVQGTKLSGLATVAAAKWAVPSVPAGNYLCSGIRPTVAEWVGLGGASNGLPLNQAGTASISCGGSSKYKFWTESLPQEQYMVYQGPAIGAGDVAISWVFHDQSIPGTTSYFLENETSGQYVTLYSYGTDWGWTSADFIVERPTWANQTYAPLPNYGASIWANCVYGTTTGNYSLMGGPSGNDNYSMITGNGLLLATASEVSNTNWISYWQNAGP